MVLRLIQSTHACMLQRPHTNGSTHARRSPATGAPIHDPISPDPMQPACKAEPAQTCGAVRKRAGATSPNSKCPSRGGRFGPKDGALANTRFGHFLRSPQNKVICNAQANIKHGGVDGWALLIYGQSQARARAGQTREIIRFGAYPVYFWE
jgi:hypothetical protein